MKRCEAEANEVEPLTEMMEELPCGCPPANLAVDEQREARECFNLGKKAKIRSLESHRHKRSLSIFVLLPVVSFGLGTVICEKYQHSFHI